MFKNKWLYLILLLLLVTCIISYLYLQNTNRYTYWQPSIEDSFQWQLSNYPIDLNIKADIYDIDLFETSKETIEQLHNNNVRFICYINVGAWEEYRDDAKDFPVEVIGNDYEGWDGEKWLDVSNYEVFSTVLTKRFDLAKEKGCDGIEPDNIEGYNEDTGFNITYNDQLEFNKWIANEVHERGMSIGLKNNPEQVSDLISYYDWVLLEDCYVWEFCNEYSEFINQSKAVFQVEYTDNDILLSDFCDDSVNNKYVGVLKHRELDEWVEVCTIR